MLEPSRAYHGVKFYETFGDFGYTMKARLEVNRTFGAVLSPLSAWLILQGTETLHLRMREHCRNALKVARCSCKTTRRCAGSTTPACRDSKYHELAQEAVPRGGRPGPGASGILTFGIEGGAQAGEKFIDACEFLSHLANIGDAKTLVIHPASTTHRQLNDAELAKAGVSADMVRLSVGIEDVDDILWDIQQALERATRA
jgi:O-acetylhomoserine (thiol)-lyase